METRQTKASRPQLTPAELEILQERVEEQQAILSRQKEAFSSEKEKFEQEKRRVLADKEEEQRRSEKALESSHRVISELRDEIRQREEELRKWGENETQNATECEAQEDVLRELEKVRREMYEMRLGNPIQTGYGPSIKASSFEPSVPLSASGENYYENNVPKLTFREALETVPYFDGYNMSVSSFARACRRAQEVMPASSERNLTRLLINRLRGRAQAAVEDEPCGNITQLIDLLTNAFGSQKTINQYRGELSIIHIRKGEHILDYISRVKDLRSAIVDSERRERGRLMSTQLADIDSLTARSFCEGLPLEYRLQFQTVCYNQPFEAFSTAKIIARRLELDKARFEGPNKVRPWADVHPVNPVGPPQAQSTPHRPAASRDHYNRRDRYHPELNDREIRPFNQRYRVNHDTYRAPPAMNYPRDQGYPRDNGNYQNRRAPETPRERYYPKEYDNQRNRPVSDRRTPDPPPTYDSGRNIYRGDQGPRTNVHANQREIERWCRYCKTDGHVIEDCRKRQYNNDRPRREVPGNAEDPSGGRDAPRGDQIHRLRPINATEAIPEAPSGSQC